MCLENLSSDMQVAIVSGGIGLLGAVIGAIATLVATWLTKRMEVAGKVSLYARWCLHELGANGSPNSDTTNMYRSNKGI